ncbi:type III pantothenate kinase [uncultured Winogradskyella sp.]|uniref:type III pantothenate kinase n=1 Tax=uncultured Winogradskyella sp. TaxID=395353 RepID=UPI002608F3A4|nr:type III pantothenate kinase [uncultured Winogradskyella sp.]
MNLIVDVGNTFVKFAIYKDEDLICKVSFELSEFKKQYNTLKKKFPEVNSAIISSVGRLSKKQIDDIKNDVKVIELSSKTKLPFKNCYKTPKTLGVDRIALVSASVNQFPDKNVLIIDAGTCITYDFITDENHYLGGAISPGIRLRYKSLNNLTANLPLLETNLPKTIIGNTTESSIHSGVVFGVIKEIDGVIDEYQENHQDLTVILTGGDAKFLSNQLKNSIFANSNFLLEGLNFILDFNSK